MFVVLVISFTITSSICNFIVSWQCENANFQKIEIVFNVTRYEISGESLQQNGPENFMGKKPKHSSLECRNMVMTCPTNVSKHSKEHSPG
jgi:hypothetical protein